MLNAKFNLFAAYSQEKENYNQQIEITNKD